MGEINSTRVLLGGLLAGLVINISEAFLNMVVFKADIEASMKSLNKTMNASGGAIAIYLCWGFLVGILAIYIYAAVRPRFGGSAKSAFRVGILMWLLVYIQSAISMAPMGLFPPMLLAKGMIAGMVEIILATLVGASIYKEEPVA